MIGSQQNLFEALSSISPTSVFSLSPVTVLCLCHPSLCLLSLRWLPSVDPPLPPLSFPLSLSPGSLSLSHCSLPHCDTTLAVLLVSLPTFLDPWTLSKTPEVFVPSPPWSLLLSPLLLTILFIGVDPTQTRSPPLSSVTPPS